MPVAVARKEPGDKIDLKTLPGAWVQLRKLDYGEILHRRDISGTAEGRQGQDTVTILMASEVTQIFEFSRCIVDHNLFRDEAETQKLDLSNARDIKSLDPKVAQEIEALIEKANNFEGLEEESKSVS